MALKSILVRSLNWRFLKARIKANASTNYLITSILYYKLKITVMDKNEFYKNILQSILNTGNTTPEFVCSKFKEIVDLLIKKESTQQE